MPVKYDSSPRSEDRIDEIIQRGYQIRRRRRMIPLGAAAVAAAVALIVIGGPTSTQTTRVHTIEPADTPTTTIPSAVSGRPSTPDAGTTQLGTSTNSSGPAATSTNQSRTAGATGSLSTSPAGPVVTSPGGPSTAGTGYTYIQVCSQPSVGPFGGPTAPPYCWTPNTLNIRVGWTVTFDGTRAFGGTVTYHTVTSNSSNWNVDAKVYSDPSSGPGQFYYTFTKTGTYTFYDRMGGGTGTVIVSR